MSVELSQVNSLFVQRESKCGLVTKGLKAALGFMKDLFFTNQSINNFSSQDLGDRVLVPRKEEYLTQKTNTSPPIHTSSTVDCDFSDDDELGLSDIDAVEEAEEVNNRGFSFSSQGLIYAIYNPDTDTCSYLLGSLHNKQDAALRNPFIPKILDRCERVYSESGLAFSDDYQNTPEVCLNYDEVVMKTALKKNKPIYPLDDVTGIAPKLAQYYRSVEKTGTIISSLEEHYIAYFDAPGITRDPKVMEEIIRADEEFSDSLNGAWMIGDAESLAKDRARMKQFPYFYENGLLRREKMWLPVLSQALQQSTQPIFIMVGVNHIVGDDGLVAQLQKEGFQVFQATFSDCSNNNFFFDD